MKQKIYIAGKVTGLERSVVEKNFDTLKEYFIQKGFRVVSPIDIVTDPATEWKAAMKICITALIDCDFIYPMSNTWDSKGAMIELDLAKSLGILVLDTVDVDDSNCRTAMVSINGSMPSEHLVEILDKIKNIQESKTSHL